MKPVVICVHGIDFRNRGALMMLDAIARFAQRACPASDVCVPCSDGTAQDRRRAAVGTALLSRRLRLGWLPLPGLAAAALGGLATTAWRFTTRHYAQSDIDLHLDASGYGYGDPWGAAKTRAMGRLAVRMTAAGTPLVVLPQAFGPFEDPAVRAATRRYLEQARLVFARDAVSRAHLDRLGLTCELAEAPDFTEFDVVPRTAAVAERRVAVVPNTRFLDVAGSGADYVERLVEIVRALIALDYAPELLVFEAGDAALAAQVAERAGGLPCQTGGTDGPATADALAAYAFVVSSRYHAAAAALHRGVPVLAFGWTHKYAGLLAEFGLAEYSFARHASAELLACLPAFTADLDAARRRVVAAHARRQTRITAMWSRVVRFLPGQATWPTAS